MYSGSVELNLDVLRLVDCNKFLRVGIQELKLNLQFVSHNKPVEFCSICHGLRGNISAAITDGAIADTILVTIMDLLKRN